MPSPLYLLHGRGVAVYGDAFYLPIFDADNAICHSGKGAVVGYYDDGFAGVAAGVLQ
jgi:hypothetical protein